MGSRMTWREIRSSEEFRGRWVALDDCRYDPRTAQPVEASVIDADEDLVELCSRIQDSENRHCAILFCDEEPTVAVDGPLPELAPPSSPASRPSSPDSVPPRAFTH